MSLEQARSSQSATNKFHLEDILIFPANFFLFFFLFFTKSVVKYGLQLFKKYTVRSISESLLLYLHVISPFFYAQPATKKPQKPKKYINHQYLVLVRLNLHPTKINSTATILEDFTTLFYYYGSRNIQRHIDSIGQLVKDMLQGVVPNK